MYICAQQAGAGDQSCKSPCSRRPMRSIAHVRQATVARYTTRPLAMPKHLGNCVCTYDRTASYRLCHVPAPPPSPHVETAKLSFSMSCPSFIHVSPTNCIPPVVPSPARKHPPGFVLQAQDCVGRCILPASTSSARHHPTVMDSTLPRTCACGGISRREAVGAMNKPHRIRLRLSPFSDRCAHCTVRSVQHPPTAFRWRGG
jgi:hypothetical protein